jgi:subfamily B ATP-binding cassette protein MsbA
MKLTIFAPETKRIYARLYAYVADYRRRVILAVVGMLGAALTEPMLPGFFKTLLDKGFVDKTSFPLWLVPVVIVAIFVLRGICTFTTNYMLSWVGNRLLNDLRTKMFTRILAVPIDFYHVKTSAKILNTLMYEVQQIVEMVRVSIHTLIRDSLTVLVLLAYLLYLNPWLTGIALCVVPLVVILIRKVSLRLRGLNRSQQQSNAELTQVIEEAIRAHAVVRIFSGQAYEKKRFNEKSESLRGYAMRATVAAACVTPATQIMAAFVVAAVVVMALVQSNHNQTTVGGFVAFIIAMLMLLPPLRRLSDLNGPLQRGLVAAESVFELIDSPVEEEKGDVLTERARGHLMFQNMSFRYPNAEQLTLKKINLEILPGQTVALVGMSGSGKSSLVNLVPRFYTPFEGKIILDEMSLENINLASLRNQIAMVNQHVVLFNDTMLANIAYGVEDVDRQKLHEAIRVAHLEGVIAELPHGLETVIGDNGSRLSGGQRQRLAIARAVYKNAPILILDEATSALDSESERVVQEALGYLMKGRTTLVIAHRLSTILSADKIAVLAQGEIIEMGTHSELLEKNGAYARLYQLQFADTDV